MSETVSSARVVFYNLKYFCMKYLPLLMMFTVLPKVGAILLEEEGNAGLQIVEHVAACLMFGFAFAHSRHKDFIILLATLFIMGQFIMTFDAPVAKNMANACFLMGTGVLIAKFYIYRYDNVRLATRDTIVPKELSGTTGH